LGLSRVGLFEAIRRDRQREGLSIRALAGRYQVHRRTVRQALASPVPSPRKHRSQAAPKLDPVTPLIDAMLCEDLTAPPQQRHTARRVLARLVDEHGVGDITYSTVRDYVRVRRVEINAEVGRCVEEAFVPQTHDPAAEAEVDFADLWIDLKGIRIKVFLFTLRLSYSGKAVHRAFVSQGQEAFLEGHVYAFERLGGTPIDKIRYDNLKSAVSRVLLDGVEWSLSGGCFSGRGMGSRRSTVRKDSPARTRRAAWRVRAAGSAAPTPSQCPQWTVLPS
jgi:transposase